MRVDALANLFAINESQCYLKIFLQFGELASGDSTDAWCVLYCVAFICLGCSLISSHRRMFRRERQFAGSFLATALGELDLPPPARRARFALRGADADANADDDVALHALAFVQRLLFYVSSPP